MSSQIAMFTVNQFTTYDPLMIRMSVCKMPPFVRGARLLPIVLDGWSRGFDPAQTAMEAVHMGYSLCVVLPLIKLEWARMDAQLAEHEVECRKEDALMKIIEAAYHCAWSNQEIHAAVKQAGLDEVSDETVGMLLSQHHDSI